LFCAIGCGVAGQLANRIVYEGATLGSIKFLMVGFLVISLILGLLPLTLLASTLARVRRAGLREYGKLANQYTEAFDEKWVHKNLQVSGPLLGTADIQSLASLGDSFAIIEQMQVTPITKRLATQIAVLASVPLIPVILLGVPLSELLKTILKLAV
jgi:hypothetical protein